MQRLMAGDEGAFRAFFDDYFPRIFRFLRRRVDGDEDAARDLVQSALIRGVRRLETYRGDSSLFTWFCQIARRELLDHLSREGRRRDLARQLAEQGHEAAWHGGDEAAEAVRDLDPAAIHAREDLAQRVHELLDGLPPHYAQVLELKYLEDLTVEEISRRLAASPISVQSLLARARAAFRDAAANAPSPANATAAASPAGQRSGR
ncbi:MAG: RNA polymerase sigma factor [Proteobacteria bacterium]|nr:RNA polymerase sigma factor [Pseudomonadota bacterium]